jgi:hypothetical protein
MFCEIVTALEEELKRLPFEMKAFLIEDFEFQLSDPIVKEIIACMKKAAKQRKKLLSAQNQLISNANNDDDENVDPFWDEFLHAITDKITILSTQQYQYRNPVISKYVIWDRLLFTQEESNQR